MISCRFEDGGTATLRHVCIDTLVLKDNKILLVRRSEKLSTEPGKWALVGGFMERDEYLQETVSREVFEETGYRIENITLLTINHYPNQPNNDRQNICFVFFCDAKAKEGTSDWEVSEQKWFEFGKLPDRSEIAFDHYLDIQGYLQYKKERLSLPIFR